MSNLSTDQWYGSLSLTQDSTPGTIVFFGFLLAIALAIPRMILWVWFVVAIVGINLSRDGTPDRYWSGWMILVGCSAMLLSWKIRAGHDRTRRDSRAEISVMIDKLKAERGGT